MNFLYERITYIFDPLHHHWEQEKIYRKISVALVLFFLSYLVVIEIKRQGLLGNEVFDVIPTNHFYAISSAFTVVLILEVISLVFTLPCSFSKSVGKQFEILSLILLRNAFKELQNFPEPLTYAGNEEAILRIASDGFGALLIFALLGYYYIVQAKASEETMRPTDLYAFVAAKKGIALLLLFTFIYMGINNLFDSLAGREHDDFLHQFYTMLILSDILVVLIAQCFQPSFQAMFRNSGFALSTLMIRIALAAPPFYNVLLGLAAAVFAILLTQISMSLFIKPRSKARET
ncbi:hypothetical protein [Desulfosediminicola ganghwensis]|uniref:hypothetical protein n=1 Tax=Desulfosediminicola ganghwensis TaxID=2569540 RepID=UPI0010ACEA60|nr:hypothetical protein [Desulfosediminicola ganghwensis]